jgi:hypothetical protein
MSNAEAEQLKQVDFADDGSAVVQLRTPVKFDGEMLSRVTIPALRGRHMMSAPDIDEDVQIGTIITWATKVVEPRGAVEDLYPQDAIAVGKALLVLLGKSVDSPGEPASPA